MLGPDHSSTQVQSVDDHYQTPINEPPLVILPCLWLNKTRHWSLYVHGNDTPIPLDSLQETSVTSTETLFVYLSWKCMGRINSAITIHVHLWNFCSMSLTYNIREWWTNLTAHSSREEIIDILISGALLRKQYVSHQSTYTQADRIQKWCTPDEVGHISQRAHAHFS